MRHGHVLPSSGCLYCVLVEGDISRRTQYVTAVAKGLMRMEGQELLAVVHECVPVEDIRRKVKGKAEEEEKVSRQCL